MKTLFLLTSIVILTSTSVLAQDDRDWNTKNYDVGDFTEIYMAGGFRVHLAQGDRNELLVKSPDNDVFDYLEVRESGGKLIISVQNGWNLRFDRIALYITFRNLNDIYIEGGAKLYTKGYLDLDDLDMRVSGGAKINMKMKANAINIVGEGGVVFDLNGIAQRLDVELSGAGHVDAEELEVKDASFKIEGVGTASVHATETLFAKIEGIGKVRYKGNPRIKKDIEGLGSVSR